MRQKLRTKLQILIARRSPEKNLYKAQMPNCQALMPQAHRVHRVNLKSRIGLRIMNII